MNTNSNALHNPDFRRIELPEKYRIAIQAAIDASAVIMEFYSNGYKSQLKTDGSPVTEADVASSNVINERLLATGIPVMDEEIMNESYAERLKWTSFWCVDPLDGTKEYIKRNGEFAVNIALVEGQDAIFGVIASPVKEEIIFGGKETGVFYCSFGQFADADYWQKIEPSTKLNDPLVMVSSRSHHHGISLDYINRLKNKFGEIAFLQKGSSLKFFDLALGKADVYPRFAPTMEWDVAAGQAIIEALNGTIINPETGKPLRYNKENLLNPHFIAETSSFLSQKENL